MHAWPVLASATTQSKESASSMTGKRQRLRRGARPHVWACLPAPVHLPPAKAIHAPPATAAPASAVSRTSSAPGATRGPAGSGWPQHGWGRRTGRSRTRGGPCWTTWEACAYIHMVATWRPHGSRGLQAHAPCGLAQRRAISFFRQFQKRQDHADCLISTRRPQQGIQSSSMVPKHTHCRGTRVWSWGGIACARPASLRDRRCWGSIASEASTQYKCKLAGGARCILAHWPRAQ